MLTNGNGYRDAVGAMRNGTLYAKNARFDGNARTLTEVDFQRIAPSVLCRTSHESRSARFAPISTWDVLCGLQREGFSPVAVKQATVREPGRAPFTKHLIRLRRLDDAGTYTVGDTVAEMVLKNANDGTCAYELMAGLFRVQCLNSLVTQTSTLDSLRVRHSGEPIQAVVAGTYRVAEAARLALAAPQDWARITLEREPAMALAEAAHILRFADAEGKVTTPIVPMQLLQPRREADRATDLWTTFNVVQENAIKGGLTGRGPDEAGRAGRGRRTTTRGVEGIDGDIRLNKALWMLGERMAALLAKPAG